jgi:flagellar biosynthesis protein FlhG
LKLFKRHTFEAPANGPITNTVNLPNRNLTLVPSTEKEIWAIGGGKGGIGKTLLTSNLALFLSWLNKKVVVIDMDLGGANLHTSLGVSNPTKTLSDLLYNRVEKANELLQPTNFRNLSLISGAHDPTGIANMPHLQKTRLSRKFREIDADFILLDLGAGTTHNTLDFFLLADKKLIVVTPEPTSVENAYRFVKAAFYRMLRASTTTPYVRQLIEQAMDQKNSRGISSPKELLNEIARLSPSDGEIIKNKMGSFSFSLIVNQVRAKSEGDIGKSIQIVCERYFGIRVDYPGFIPYDNAVWQSIRKRVPFLIEAPNSTAVTHLEEIVRNILKKNEPKR